MSGVSPPALNAFSIALVLAQPAATTGLFTLLDLIVIIVTVYRVDRTQSCDQSRNDSQ
jgi:hypothetical protein